MRISNFQTDFLFGVAALLSINPDRDLSDEFARQWTAFLNTWIRSAWQAYDWAELFVTEERAFRPIWRADQDWFTGDEVYYLPTFTYYRALQEIPFGLTPPSNNAYWSAISATSNFQDGVENSTTLFTSSTAGFSAADLNQGITADGLQTGTFIAAVNSATSITLSAAATKTQSNVTFTVSGRTGQIDKFVAYDQIGQRPIGEMRGVYNLNPRTYPRLNPPGIRFRPSQKGIDVWPFTGNTVFINYKVPVSQFVSNPWEPGTYSYGDEVFWTDGNCYTCGVSSTTTSPSDLSNRYVVPLPTFLLEYLKRVVAGDAADDVQSESVMLLEAEDFLMNEVRILGNQGHVAKYRIRSSAGVTNYGGYGNWCSSAPWTGGFVSTLTDALFNPFGVDRRPNFITDLNEARVTDTGEPRIIEATVPSINLPISATPSPPLTQSPI